MVENGHGSVNPLLLIKHCYSLCKYTPSYLVVDTVGRLCDAHPDVGSPLRASVREPYTIQSIPWDLGGDKGGMWKQCQYIEMKHKCLNPF